LSTCCRIRRAVDRPITPAPRTATLVSEEAFNGPVPVTSDAFVADVMNVTRQLNAMECSRTGKVFGSQ
jgi:hypothetical protein